MVERSPDLDGIFRALADPTRRAMLAGVAGGPRSIGDLAAPHRISFAAAAKHVKVLEAAGLLRKEVRGRQHLCHLQAAPLHHAADFLAAYARFWSRKLDALEALLDEEAADVVVEAAVTETRKRRTAPSAARKGTDHGR